MATDVVPGEISLHLLGTPRLLRSGVPVPLPSRRTTALLAYLATEGGAIRRDRLCDVLWDDPMTARKNLRVLLSHLRRAVPDHLVVDRDAVALDVDNLDVDVRRFEESVSDGRASGSHALRDAAATFTGDFLDGLDLRGAASFALWRDGERARLRSLVMSAYEAVAIAALGAGDLEVATAVGRRMLHLDASDENAARILMEALGRSGRRSEALSVFATSRALTEDELGLTLLPETIELAAALRDGRVSVGRGRPLLHDLDSIPGLGDSAATATDLVGRADLVADCQRRVGDGVLTFTGRGGVGKTALALEVVRSSGRVPVIIDVAGLDDVDQVAAAALAMLGRPVPSADPWELMVDALDSGEHVLVLDSAEMLGDHLAGALAEIRRRLPLIGVVVTSRSPLRVAGEHVVTVPCLGLPEVSADAGAMRDAPAVALFLIRAARSGCDIADPDLAAVADVCRLLDGLPLAIELAVPLLSIYSVAGLLEQLSRPGADVLGLLAVSSDGSTGLEARTLRSYGLLSAETQAIFRRLSVFEAPFDLEAAAAVSGIGETAVLGALTRLTRLHLAERASDASQELRLPKTVRAAAHNLLSDEKEQADTAAAYCEHFRALASRARRELESVDEVAWLARLDVCAADLRSSIERLQAVSRFDDALEMATALGAFWLHGGRAAEGCSRLESLLRTAPESGCASSARQWIFRLRVDVHGDESDIARAAARALAVEIGAMGDDVDLHDRLRAMSMLGHVLNLVGEDAEARVVTAEAIDRARQTTSWWLPELLHRSALLAAADGRNADALRDAHAGYEFARRLGNGHMQVQCALGLLQTPGHEALGLQLPDLQGVLELARSTGDRRSEGWVIASLGAVAVFEGDIDSAAAWFLEGVKASLCSGSRQTTWFCLVGAAAIAVLDGDLRFAARLHGAILPRLPQLRREMPAEYVDVYVSLLSAVDDLPESWAAVRAGSTLSASSALVDAEHYLEARAC